jgi:hypothetical protein
MFGKTSYTQIVDEALLPLECGEAPEGGIQTCCLAWVVFANYQERTMFQSLIKAAGKKEGWTPANVPLMVSSQVPKGHVLFAAVNDPDDRVNLDCLQEMLARALSQKADEVLSVSRLGRFLLRAFEVRPYEPSYDVCQGSGGDRCQGRGFWAHLEG